ncbi:MAG: DAK2 domain-containing protein [Clostridiales bacterium]|nr:DAK2 domain-containing protein [Clostridiales bacterium]
MITGLLLRDAIISAANNINSFRKEVDAMNVFPVPDGDTGTNMSMTIDAAAREAKLLPDNADISVVAEKVASALLRGARGNSGVILSLIFRGFSKGLKGVKEANGKILAAALRSSVDAAYKAVMKPTEGTILTVIRIAADKAHEAANKGQDVLDVWDAACKGAAEALATTPDLLPVLKKAGVVDAGGQGLVYIFDGMTSVFKNGVIVTVVHDGDAPAVEEHFAAAHASDEHITFTYCTEYIVKRANAKDPLKLRAYLESIGDSAVVVDDNEIIKVHLHTDEPGNALQAAIKYGSLMSIKIDNMREQHQNIAWGVADKAPASTAPPVGPAQAEKQFGMVAVSAGPGIEELFLELGVDKIVNGGQTMNPSTESILEAVLATPAEHIFVLPNNKNIIMAAEQVIPLTQRKVSVLHTKSIPQGIAAALTLDPEISANENHLAMMKAAEKVATGLVTYAARDSLLEGENIKKGQILGMENGKITVVDSSPVQAAYRVTKHLFKKGASSIITVIFGADTSAEQTREILKLLEDKFGNDAEISIVNGGQPVYYFIISVE